MNRTLVAAPRSGLITMEQAKEHLRVTVTDEDELIEAIIYAATESVEHSTNRCFIKRSYKNSWPVFADYFLAMPLDSITSVEYYDSDNALQTVSASDYSINKTEGQLIFNSDYSFPSVYDRHDGFQVTYTAGYDVVEIPAQAVAACKLIAADLFENREGQHLGLPAIPNETVARLLAGLRVHTI